MRQLEPLLRRLIDFGLFSDEEEQIIDKSLLQIETKIQPKTDFILFFEEYNKIRNTRYQPDVESRKLFYENEVVYTNAERLTALKNALTDPYWIERSFSFEPKWILKPENLSKYLTYAAPNNKSNSKRKGPDRDTVA